MTIANANIPAASGDLVAILDSSGNQVFPLAQPLSASVDPEIRYMVHPVENGGSIIDHRVVLPVIVNVELVLTAGNYRNTYQDIRQAAEESRQLIVQTKSSTFSNMYITAYPSEENSNFFDTIVVNLTFREVQFDTARTQTLSQDQVRNPADSSTVNRGEQSGMMAEIEGSVLSGIFG